MSENCSTCTYNEPDILDCTNRCTCPDTKNDFCPSPDYRCDFYKKFGYRTDILFKPCPFCGSPNVRMRKTVVTNYVFCRNCDMDGPSGKTEEEALKAWNQRIG